MISSVLRVFRGLVFAAAVTTVSIGYSADSVRPSATLSGPPSPTTQSPFAVQIDWSEPVTGFDLSDISVTNGTASDLRAPMTTAAAILSQARSNLAAASVGTKVLFAGGYTSVWPSGPSRAVDIYDSATNTWTVAALSYARSGLAAASVGTKVLFGGGTTVDIFDNATNTWSKATLSHTRSGPAAASVGTKVLFGGGYTCCPSGYSNAVDIYDNATNRWTVAALSQGRYNLAAASAGTKVLFGGGLTGSGPTGAVDIYDSATNTWTIAALSQARYDLAAASVGTKVLFGGGYVGTLTYSSVVDIYDSATNTWSTAALSQARCNLAAASAGTKVFFGGGEVLRSLYSRMEDISVVDIYDSADDTWTTAELSQARHDLAAASVGTKVLFGGGDSIFGSRKEVDIFEFAHTANITPATEGLVTVSVPEGTCTDLAGNPNTASNVLSIDYDIVVTWDAVRPACSLTGPASPTDQSPFAVQFGWDEPVTGFDLSDIAVTNGTASDLQEEITQTTSALSEERYGLAAASAGTKVLFGGGFLGDFQWMYSYSNRVDIYDSTSGTWITASLSRARRYLAAASAGTKVLFAGGQILIEDKLVWFPLHYNTVDIYDSATGTWTAAALSQARSSLAAASVGSKVFFGGGYSEVVDIYDVANGTWTQESLSQARGGLAAASAGTKVLFAGGYATGSGYSSVVDIFDSATSAWTTATLSQARRSLAGAAVGTKVLFGGGYVGSSIYSSVVDIFDSASDTWSTTALSQARSDLAAASVGTKVLFGGGYSDSGASSVVDIYDSTSDTWSTAALLQARSGPAAASVGTKVLFGSGNTVDIFDFAHTAKITPAVEGLVTVSVPESVCTDLAGNPNTASNVLSIIYDTVAPSCSVTGPSATNTSPVLFAINFSESVTGLGEAGINVTGGTKGTLTGSGSGPYTLPVSPGGQGEITCQVAAGAAQDAVGRLNTASNSLSIIYDSVPPAAPSIAGLDPASDSGVSSTDRITNMTAPVVVGTAEPGAAVALLSGAAALGSGTADGSGNWSVQPGPLADGTHTLTARATDQAGNVSPASAGVDVTIDTVAPSVAMEPVLPNPRVTPVGSVALSFTSPVFNFDVSDLSLSRDGTPVSLAGATLTGSGANWTIENLEPLTPADGVYRLSVNVSDITDEAGNALAAPAWVDWTMDPVADVALSMAADPAAAVVGQPLSFGLSVSNLGPGPATNVVVSDMLPAGATFTTASVSQGNLVLIEDGVAGDLGSMARDETATMTVTVIPQTEGPLANWAGVTSSVHDPDTLNNVAATTVTVTAGTGPDLAAVSLQAHMRSLRGGRCRLTGRLRLTNQGDAVSGETTVAFYLSDSRQRDSSATLLGSTRLRPVGPGQSRLAGLTVRTELPATARYVISVIDPANTVAETNELNNTAACETVPR